jgi:hypothetical protein
MFRMSAGTKIDDGISISKPCGRDGELLLLSLRDECGHLRKESAISPTRDQHAAAYSPAPSPGFDGFLEHSYPPRGV